MLYRACLGLSTQKKKQPIVNPTKFPEKNQRAHCKRGGVGGLGSKCATGTLQTGRWQHKEGSKWLQSKVFTQKKTDLMVGPKVAESGGKEETPR